MDTSKLNRRYHLHRKLKKQNISISIKSKTIFQDVDQEINSKDVQELVQVYNYQIQLQIPI